jgi:hypothetical protein
MPQVHVAFVYCNQGRILLGHVFHVVSAMQSKKGAPAPHRLRATSITSAAAAAAAEASVKMMSEEDAVLEMSGADLITKRLATWCVVNEEEEEEDTIVVDENKVPSHTSTFCIFCLLLVK